MNGTTRIPTRVRFAAVGSTVALAAGLTLGVAAPAYAAAPIGGDDAYPVSQDTALTVGDPGLFVNDSDPEGDAFGFHSVWPPAGGTLPGEELQTTPGGGFVYTPPTGYSGTRTWQYRLEDATDVSDYVDVVFTIAPAAPSNTAPTPTADAFDVVTNGSLNIPAPGLLANDSDADGDALTIVAQGYTGGSPAGEAMTTWPDGSMSYLAPTGFTGVRTWWYEVSDGTATTQASITFTIADAPAGNVTPPVAVDDAYSVLPGSSFVAVPGVLGNDTDADGDALTVVQVTPGDPALPGETLVIGADGKVDYTAPAGFDGLRYWYYEVSDGAYTDWGAVVFDVDPNLLNLTPSPADDAYAVVKDTTLTVAGPGLLDNDWDFEGDPLTVLSYVQPDVWLPGELFSVDVATGGFSYTPPTGFVGTRVLDYDIHDGFHPSSGYAQITFTIAAAAAEPTDPTDPTDPSDPPLPTLPDEPGAPAPRPETGQGTLASTGQAAAGIAGIAGLAGILVALGILARRLARREA